MTSGITGLNPKLIQNQGVSTTGTQPSNGNETASAANSEVMVESQDGQSQAYNVTINDTASATNEAADLRAEMENQGLKLKDIAKEFKSMSDTSATEMKSALKEIEGHMSYITVTEAETQVIADETEDLSAELEAEVAKNEAEVANKEAELNEAVAQAEKKMEQQVKAQEEGEVTIIDSDTTDIDALSEELTEIADSGAETVAQIQSEASASASQLKGLTAEMKSMANDIGKAYNKAIDAQELGNETVEVGQDLRERGEKIGMIGAALMGAAGGVAGAFAGREVAIEVQYNKIQKEQQEGNPYAQMITKDDVRYDKGVDGYRVDISNNNVTLTHEYSKNFQAGRSVGMAAGALAGAGLGAAVGSLFGMQSRKAGEETIMSGVKLNAVSNGVKNTAAQIASQNNIAIEGAQTIAQSVASVANSAAATPEINVNEAPAPKPQAPVANNNTPEPEEPDTEKPKI